MKSEETNIRQKTGKLFLLFNQALSNAETLLKYSNVTQTTLAVFCGNLKKYFNEKREAESGTSPEYSAAPLFEDSAAFGQFYQKVFKDKKSEFVGDELQRLKENVAKLLIILESSRNYYSHHFHSHAFKTIPRGFHRFLEELFERAKFSVAGSLGEAVENDRYQIFNEYSIDNLLERDGDSYRLTDKGLVFIACFFLNEQDGNELISSTPELKRTEKATAFEATRKIYLYGSKEVKYLFEKQEAGNVKVDFLRFAEIYSYLNLIPEVTAIYGELKPKEEEKEIFNSRIRRNNRFPFFAASYLMHFNVLKGIEFETQSKELTVVDKSITVGSHDDMEISKTTFNKSYGTSNGKNIELLPRIENNNALLRCHITAKDGKQKEVRVMIGERELKNILFQHLVNPQHTGLGEKIKAYAQRYYQAMERVKQLGTITPMEEAGLDMPKLLPKLATPEGMSINIRSRCEAELKRREELIRQHQFIEAGRFQKANRHQVRRLVWECLKWYIPRNRRDNIGRESLNQISIALYLHGSSENKIPTLERLRMQMLLPTSNTDQWSNNLYKAITAAGSLRDLEARLNHTQVRKQLQEFPSDLTTTEAKVMFLIKRMMPRAHGKKLEQHTDAIAQLLANFGRGGTTLLAELNSLQLLDSANQPEWVARVEELFNSNQTLEKLYQFLVNDYAKGRLTELNKQLANLPDDKLPTFAEKELFIEPEAAPLELKDYLDSTFFKPNSICTILIPQGFGVSNTEPFKVGNGTATIPLHYDALHAEEVSNPQSVSQQIRKKFAAHLGRLRREKENYYKLNMDGVAKRLRRKSIGRINEEFTKDILLLQIAEKYYTRYLRLYTGKKKDVLNVSKLQVEGFNKKKLTMKVSGVNILFYATNINALNTLTFDKSMAELIRYLQMKDHGIHQKKVELIRAPKNSNKNYSGKNGSAKNRDGETVNLYNEMEQKNQLAEQLADAILTLEKALCAKEIVQPSGEYVSFSSYVGELRKRYPGETTQLDSLNEMRNRAAHHQPPFKNVQLTQVSPGAYFSEFGEAIAYVKQLQERVAPALLSNTAANSATRRY